MATLPSGTVTLLFSDIEGSTVLLSRLGDAYADALDGQRWVLRKAWAEHGGTELGTEGDSFYVVFPTAEGAVAAAVQGQRDLAVFPWPGGERVKVRMGIHTGSPRVHDGAYVGMDVHRAARIAGAAHGGQVVVSEVTAKLVAGCLPDRVTLRDLGSHRLKDLQVAERLLQLNIEGLQVDFPTVKTLGAASTLPQPSTPLVGREGELAELAALLSPPEVRLVTLTGPGGSGKTRLAICLAQRLIERFPDGVYFVSLAAATSVNVMWTSIAEALEVPAEGRMPPGLFSHVAHRSALMVLDNLEQIEGADQVVAELLAVAPDLVVIATSRSPLTLDAEHLYPVPPLQLPEDSGLDAVAASGAVQLFVGRARRAKPSFALAADNAAEIAQVCRRLDGLPLAIELAAARTRLLSPAALLSRLDTALELKDTALDRPTRQQTLRGTIAWSYDLLNSKQQALFRALGIFAGGADLEAINAVTTQIDDAADRLDLVADLVDANLAIVTEDDHGQPRVGMLATIHAFAQALLAASSDGSIVGRNHAEHYLQLADRLHALRKVEYLEARNVGAKEIGNFRQALDWLLDPHSESDGLRQSLGLRLCVAMCWLWRREGYLAEGQRWCERAIQRADGMPSKELASCLHWLAEMLLAQGDVQYARVAATRSLAMARSVGDQDATAFALASLATVQSEIGDLDGSDDFLEQALATSRQSGDRHREAATLGDLAINAVFRRDYDTAQQFASSALEMSIELGAVWLATRQRLLLVEVMAITGRSGEAHKALAALIDDVLQLADVSVTAELADIFVIVLARLDDPIRAAHLLGAADGACDRIGLSRPHTDEAKDVITAARALLGSGQWDRHYHLGHAENIEDLLHDASSNPPDALRTQESSV